MAVSDRDKLKTFFQPGSIPLAHHFAGLIDSPLNKMADGVKKEAKTGLKILAAPLNNGRRDAILLYGAFEESISLTKAQDQPFSIQLETDTPGNFLKVEYADVSAASSTVIVNHGVPTNGAAAEFDASTPGQLIITINGPTLAGQIESAWNSLEPADKNGFSLSVIGNNPGNISPSFPGGGADPVKWKIALLDDGTNRGLSIRTGAGANDFLFIEETQGNVGIGITAAPTEKLEVGGVVKSTGLAVNGHISIGDPGKNPLDISQDSDTSFLVQSGSTTIFKLLSDGKVGIGTTEDPSEMLEVNGTVKSSGLQVNGHILIGDPGKNPLDISQDGDTSFLVQSGSTTIFKLLNDGKVGIGITGSPTEALEVNGTVKSTGLAVNGHISIGDPDKNPLAISQDDDTSFLVQSGSTTIFKLLNDGKVGIGTTGDPTEMLEVNGAVKSTSLTVTNILSVGGITDMEAKIRQLETYILSTLAVGDTFEGGIIVKLDKTPTDVTGNVIDRTDLDLGLTDPDSGLERLPTQSEANDAFDQSNENRHFIGFAGRTYDDWRLPTQSELEGILADSDLNLAAGDYMSSDMADGSPVVITLTIGDGGSRTTNATTDGTKTKGRVRPIRDFSFSFS
jgi:hypothetical protein